MASYRAKGSIFEIPCRLGPTQPPALLINDVCIHQSGTYYNLNVSFPLTTVLILELGIFLYFNLYYRLYSFRKELLNCVIKDFNSCVFLRGPEISNYVPEQYNQLVKFNLSSLLQPPLRIHCVGFIISFTSTTLNTLCGIVKCMVA